MVGSREWLRRGTREQHRLLESRPFFAAMLGEELELASYVAWLRALTTVVGALEASLREARDASVQRLVPEPRVGALRADAAAYDDVPMPDSGIVGPTLELVERLRGWRAERPRALVGALYVFEGSALGARIQRPHLLRFERDGAGVAYPTALAMDARSRWEDFCARLDDLPASEGEHEAIVAAAREVFEGLAAMADALDPGRAGTGRDTLRWLNDSAGDHPVPHDPREVLAAVDAGLATWARHPYYAARYGARGQSFTRSDSAWLVTLSGVGDSEADAHVDWLARLLAGRGMPGLLLEEHLRRLAETLGDAVPERAPRYARLARAADRLRARRLQALPAFAELAASFTGDGEPRGVGALVVSAAADERNDIDAVPSLLAWLRDPERFSPSWIAAVDELLERARSA